MDRIRSGLFSAITNVPFRAGKLAIERVNSQTMDSNPALCLVFFSERYADPELVHGIIQKINPDVVAGCSTNGEIAAGYWRESVIAISLSTDFMRFGIAVEANEKLANANDGIVYEDFYKRALTDLRNKLLFQENKMVLPVNPKHMNPDFGLLFLPGTDPDSEPKANTVIQGLRKYLGEIPLIGGSIGDDYNYENGYVIFKDEFLENHTLLILGRSDLEFSMAQVHGYHIKKEFTVTKAINNRIVSLNNEPASLVYFRELNLPVVEISDLRDEICALNPFGIKDQSTGELQILFPMSRGKEAKELTVSQVIPEGATIYFTEAELDAAKKASLDAIKKAYVDGAIKDPRLGILFSCGGRSTFYFDRALAEIEEIKKRFKYTNIGGAYLYGTLCGKNNWVSEGSSSVLLIGNELRKRPEMK
ncbi:MAG: hypothetical protein DRP02_07200 [Candidatus Gerdarchaeota archaeon]|nr:MAG: hypothetical protein DRP02_07200 [Candidatus Gerdarchaeota archaeon]